MLVLKRKEGQWVEIVHRSGDVIRIRVYDIQAGGPSRVNVAFDDSARNFEIRRPERKATTPRPPRFRPTAPPSPAAAAPPVVDLGADPMPISPTPAAGGLA